MNTYFNQRFITGQSVVLGQNHVFELTLKGQKLKASFLLLDYNCIVMMIADTIADCFAQVCLIAFKWKKKLIVTLTVKPVFDLNEKFLNSKNIRLFWNHDCLLKVTACSVTFLVAIRYVELGIH